MLDKLTNKIKITILLTAVCTLLSYTCIYECVLWYCVAQRGTRFNFLSTVLLFDVDYLMQTAKLYHHSGFQTMLCQIMEWSHGS